MRLQIENAMAAKTIAPTIIKAIFISDALSFADYCSCNDKALDFADGYLNNV